MEQKAFIKRIRFTFRGIVQGVGFRPTVFRCADASGVAGFVQNRRSIVVAEVEGTETAIEQFRRLLDENLPEAAVLDSVDEEEMPPADDGAFEIIESESSDYLFPPIPPDLALCSRCREELLDPSDRRYLYPFITCTQCGPRYSIVEDTPFDRDTTSMDDFDQCPDCLEEYTNPKDRRFHSQTNSCAACGPELKLLTSGGETVEGDPVTGTVTALNAGKIVAIQGIGGFHLAADPSRPGTAARLREDKERQTKPFALMVRDLAEAENLCRIGPREQALLSSPEGPICILPARTGIPEYLKHVSDTDTLGIMLPYTPLHLLLFMHPEIEIGYRHLIMTSGNRKKEPIITDPQEAVEKLADTADFFLFHNRRIMFHTDDSVVRPPREGSGEAACIIRRSRGYVPRIFTLQQPISSCTLAAGGDLKNAPAFAEGNMVYLAPFIGDLEEPLTMEAFEKTVRRILKLYNIKPKRVVYDMHPRYFSSQWAESAGIEEKVRVQHHYAHILSVMAEHGLTETLGVSFDGTGFGTDGTIWGGEFLYAERSSFQRLGSLAPFRLPGGEAAIKQPMRTAFSILSESVRKEEADSLCGFSTPEAIYESVILKEIIGKGLNSPLTSSAGRIFDAAAAVLGFVETVYFEGEGPIKMEGAAAAFAGRSGFPAGGSGTEGDRAASFMQLTEEPGGDLSFLLAHSGLLRYIAEQRAAGGEGQAGRLALLFHEAVAEGIKKALRVMAAETGMKTVCLSGGVFQNMLLRSILIPELRKEGYTVFTNSNVPPGDGGIALGQAYYL